MAYIFNGKGNAPTIFDIFNRPITDFDFMGSKHATKSFSVDVRDLGDSYLLEADLPGTVKEDIHLNFEEGVLSISAEHHTAQDDANAYLIHEREAGSYERSFRFQDADPDAIKASFENATLRIVLSKVQARQSREIEIN